MNQVEAMIWAAAFVQARRDIARTSHYLLTEQGPRDAANAADEAVGDFRRLSRDGSDSAREMNEMG